MAAVILLLPWNTARVRLFATHSHNPLVVYKAFQFAIISNSRLIPASPLGYDIDCNDFGLLFLYSSHIGHEHALVVAHACVHACIVAHMDLYIIVMAYSSTQYTCTYLIVIYMGTRFMLQGT